MKKNLVRSILVVTLLTFSMVGCGKNNEEQAAEQPQVSQEEEQPVVQEEEQVTQQEEVQEPVVEETEQEEPVVEEPAEVEEKTTAKNEPIMNSEPIGDWINSFSIEEMHNIIGEELKFIVHNEVEGYKLILNDGESYQLKKDDNISLYSPKYIEKIGSVDTNLKLKSVRFTSTHTNDFLIDWDYYDESVEVGRKVILEDETEPRTITCTFYKPAE